MFKIINPEDSKERSSRSYFSTHEFISQEIDSFSIANMALILKKTHPIRKIQDKFCYIHAIQNDIKTFTPKQHKKLETAIRNNLKLFQLFYVDPKPDPKIFSFMFSEAIKQKNLLKTMSYTQVILNRISQINFFLCYSYSRSLDHFKVKGLSIE